MRIKSILASTAALGVLAAASVPAFAADGTAPAADDIMVIAEAPEDVTLIAPAPAGDSLDLSGLVDSLSAVFTKEHISATLVELINSNKDAVDSMIEQFEKSDAFKSSIENVQSYITPELLESVKDAIDSENELDSVIGALGLTDEALKDMVDSLGSFAAVSADDINKMIFDAVDASLEAVFSDPAALVEQALSDVDFDGINAAVKGFADSFDTSWLPPVDFSGLDGIVDADGTIDLDELGKLVGGIDFGNIGDKIGEAAGKIDLSEICDMFKDGSVISIDSSELFGKLFGEMFDGIDINGLGEVLNEGSLDMPKLVDMFEKNGVDLGDLGDYADAMGIFDLTGMLADMGVDAEMLTDFMKSFMGGDSSSDPITTPPTGGSETSTDKPETKPTDSTANPNTGVEGVAAVVGLITVAGATVVISRKKD